MNTFALKRSTTGKSWCCRSSPLYYSGKQKIGIRLHVRASTNSTSSLSRSNLFQLRHDQRGSAIFRSSLDSNASFSWDASKLPPPLFGGSICLLHLPDRHSIYPARNRRWRVQHCTGVSSKKSAARPGEWEIEQLPLTTSECCRPARFCARH